MYDNSENAEIEAIDPMPLPPVVDHGFRSTGRQTLKLIIIWGSPIVK